MTGVVPKHAKSRPRAGSVIALHGQLTDAILRLVPGPEMRDDLCGENQ